MGFILNFFQCVIQPVISLILTMKQRELPYFGVVPEPRFATDAELALCKSYREAVRLSWELRVSRGMTQATAAERTGLYAPHLSEFLNKDDKPSRRDLPMDKVKNWCYVVGNWVVLQYITRDAQLNIMEEMIAQRAA